MKEIVRKKEYGNYTPFIETCELENKIVINFQDNCNLTTCRYNKDGKCVSHENRVVCVDVSKKVLCMGDNKDANN